MHKYWGNDKRAYGFTLIEVIMSLVLVSFLAGSIIMFTKPVMDLWLLQTFQQGTGTEGRLALMRMVRDINQIKSRTLICTATATNLTFVDTSSNNTCGSPSIAYTLTSGSLTRNSVAIAKGVSGLAFAYYDVNNATTATLANIRRISIQYTVTGGGRSVTLRSHAHPRNLY